jgi:lysophospholipase L1-like esterase
VDWYEADVASLLSTWSAQPPAAGGIVFYGSSSIRMWETLQEDFPDLPVINAGFGGSTLAACVWFFERIVVPLAPASLVLYAGDNDLGDGQSPQQVLESLRSLLGKVAQHFPEIPVCFLSIKPSPARRHLLDRIRETNGLALGELQAHPHACFVNLFDSMLAADGQPIAELFAEDGLHLSPAGYRLWREVLSLHRSCFLPADLSRNSLLADPDGEDS